MPSQMPAEPCVQSQKNEREKMAEDDVYHHNTEAERAGIARRSLIEFERRRATPCVLAPPMKGGLNLLTPSHEFPQFSSKLLLVR